MNQDFDILIVEDEKVVNESAAKILKAEGYSVDQVFDGETAVAKVVNNRYKIIITDLMLKEMSGKNLIELIKKKYYHIPIIMITGYTTIINVFDAFKAGAYDYIPKPFTYDELMSVVTRAIEYSQKQSLSDQVNNYFENNIPGKNMSKLYFMGNHSWVYFEDEGTAIIGLGKTFATAVNEITNIEFTGANDGIIQGNSFIELNKKDFFNYRVWAPISGNVIMNNNEIIDNIDLIKTDKYINKWLTRIKPENLEKELIHLSPYMRH